LIFLDLRMPNMDGFAVLDALKTDPVTKNIPVAIHTSQRLQAWEKDRLTPHAVGFVDKELLNQAPGRACVEEILTQAGMGLASLK
jgi:CheY-like chemotaxis protein